MTTRRISPLILMILVPVFCSMGQVAYKTQSTKMTVTGSSTLHEWTSEVTQVNWSGLITVNNNQIETTNVIITIPVTAIKSEHGKMMDNKTYDAFKYEKNPTITYKVTSSQSKVTGNETQLEAIGTLTMAGVTKQLPLQLKSKTLPNGDLLLSSSRKIKMTDFKMDPPTAMMGTITVGEEVTLNFEITLTPNKI